MKNFKTVFLIMIFAPVLLLAGGISTSFVEVMVENLEPGKTYSMLRDIKYPYKIINNSGKSIQVKVSAKQTADRYLRKKFAKIPDVSWIKIEPELITVGPNEEKPVDIIFTLPPDKQYYGKQYQVNILAQTLEQGGISIGLALESVLLFTTAEEGVEVNDPDKDINLNFNLDPANVTIDDIKIRNTRDLIIRKSEFNIINKNEEVKIFNIKLVNVSDTLKPMRKGYADLPDFSMIKLKTDKLELKKNQTGRIEFELRIPDMDEYKNKKYQFIIFTYIGDEEQSSGKFVNVYVNL